MTAITQKRIELKNVQKQINLICKKPYSQWKFETEETRAFYFAKLKSLEFQKIDLLDQIIKLQP
ncbi:hypothetical protein UFOVP611_35 [uncultured Caudovirales phage]|uniref:Uncharacterized protein n=1 Tax=uncultured Caudovirales phage TaxID=2100421 RepID=A0A6J5N2G0_9CAUD|nr:hypothetical protein UFOVP611_35 [uncultured Caudovirales phage]